MNTETRTTTIATSSDMEVTMTRTFDAPRELLFDVFTSAEHLPHWQLGPEGWTMPVCEIDLREGGAWRSVWRKSDGTEMEMTGTYREVSRPERFVSTEAWGGDWPVTVNTNVFTEDAGRTTVVTTMLYPSKEARDAALATGMQDGADTSYDRLDDYLSTLS